jgi:AraC-like DNA-binding protein
MHVSNAATMTGSEQPWFVPVPRRVGAIGHVPAGRPRQGRPDAADQLSTAGLAANESFEFWRCALNESFVAMDAGPVRGKEFYGFLRTEHIGALQVSEIVTGAHQVFRTRKLINSADEEYYKLCLQLRGECTLTQDGRDVELGPSDFAIYDTTRPFTLAFDDTNSQLVVMLPRKLLRLPDSKVAKLTAQRIPSQRGVGALLAPFLHALPAQARTFDPATGVRVAENVIDLLGTLLTEQLGVPATPESARRALMVRILGYIERHLGEHSLGADEIAAAHFISRRYLHKLFQEQGLTVAGRIRDRRLENCYRDLADQARCGEAVSTIAARWGFTDAAHFSRLFKATFGLSPRDHRLAHTRS